MSPEPRIGIEYELGLEDPGTDEEQEDQCKEIADASLEGLPPETRSRFESLSDEVERESEKITEFIGEAVTLDYIEANGVWGIPGRVESGPLTTLRNYEKKLRDDYLSKGGLQTNRKIWNARIKTWTFITGLEHLNPTSVTQIFEIANSQKSDLPESQVDTIKTSLERWNNYSNVVFWGRVSTYAESIKPPCAEQIMLLSYLQTLTPLKEPIKSMPEKDLVSWVDQSAAQAELPAMYRSLPTLKYVDAELEKYIAAEIAILAIGKIVIEGKT